MDHSIGHKKVQFVHDLKMFKFNRGIKWNIEICLKEAGVFKSWKDNVPEGIYKKILNYHQSTTSKAEVEVQDKAKAGDSYEAKVEDKDGDGSASVEVQSFLY